MISYVNKRANDNHAGNHMRAVEIESVVNMVGMADNI